MTQWQQEYSSSVFCERKKETWGGGLTADLLQRLLLLLLYLTFLTVGSSNSYSPNLYSYLVQYTERIPDKRKRTSNHTKAIHYLAVCIDIPFLLDARLRLVIYLRHQPGSHRRNRNPRSPLNRPCRLPSVEPPVRCSSNTVEIILQRFYLGCLRWTALIRVLAPHEFPNITQPPRESPVVLSTRIDVKFVGKSLPHIHGSRSSRTL